MAIEKVSSVDVIEISDRGVVMVRTKTAFMEDGVEVSGSFHRHAISPGADYSKEDPRVRAICKVTHTPEVIAAYKNAGGV